ncbi:hypothetical protein [Nodularia sp. NIES-3585]|uniref:hypothetical protein n=1 Tax=Nodularia sp. NIES-3585 TaxID=1973477 RepID=UPI000B5C2DB8|nr:hypothetical protein [Nodularia sp. NIES-3585]GAX37522.1 hypothetical protein NIES3585_35650 [Nodularia sp. NIES-3585]
MNLKKKYRQPQGKLMLDKAKNYIKERQWLFSDYDFEGVIDMCEAGISIEEEEFTMTINQESQTNLNLALSLNVPTSISLNVDFEKVKEESFSFSLKTRVEFW